MASSEASVARSVLRQALEALRPPPALSVAEWAAENRILNTSSPLPGKWSNRTAPFLTEVMNCLSPSHPAQMVVFQKSAQIGASECLLNALGFYLEHAPAPILLVQPTTEAAKKFSRHRLEPMLSSTPALKAIVRDPRSRDAHNTVLLKQTLTGSTLLIGGANSSIALRSTPVKVLLADEIDGWPLDVDQEGSPFDLALQRTVAFSASRKILAISTPTIEGFSRIATLYAESDQRKYFLPCPFCGYFQTLTWDQLRWEQGKPDTARYFCVSCGEGIENHRKAGMLAAGEWRPTATGDGRTVGFHLSQLYCPPGWPSWPDLARSWIKAQGSKEVLQTFVNCSLGEVWKDEAAQVVDADVLYSRREPYPAEVPMGAALLTAGVDVQDDRLECEVVGWGRNEESWSIAYHVLYDDPTLPNVWQDLDRLLLKAYRHESGFDLHVSACCVDSGYHSAEVIEFCRSRMARKVWAVKGVSGFGKPIFPRRTGGRHGAGKSILFLVGVDSGKEKVYAKLRVEQPGPGFAHFPLTRDREYFAQLTSERIATKHTNGFPQRVWVKSPSVRNECLDIRVYATAALHGLYQHSLSLESHVQQFELMRAPAADRPGAYGYEVKRSSWLS